MERVFKMTGLLCWALWATAGTASFGQAAAVDDSKPSSLNNVDQDYPRVDSQMRVHFRVQAPNAQKVQIKFSNPLDPQTPFDMLKGENGAWTLTSAPMQGGFHYYQVVIDGVGMPDPAVQPFVGNGS